MNLHDLNALLLTIHLGITYNDSKDCRTTGCVSGECVKQSNKFVCKQSEFDFIYVLLLSFLFNH